MKGLCSIIIHYGPPDLTHSLLECLSRYEPKAGRPVVIVDNGSPQPFSVPSQNQGLHLLRIEKGVGFGAACEAGVQFAKEHFAPDAYVLLNNDLTFSSDVITALGESLERHPQAGLIGPKIIFPDGRFQLSWGDDLTLQNEFEEKRCQAEMHARAGRRYEARERQSQSKQKVDWISGAAFLLTDRAHHAIGGLNNGYYFYFEDCDWSRRVRETGFEVWYDSAIEVTHALGASRPRSKKDPRSLRFHRSRELGHLLYYARYCSCIQYQCLKVLLLAKAIRAADFRFFFALLLRSRKRAINEPISENEFCRP